MGKLGRLTWIALIIGLLAAAGLAMAETDWEDSVSDPAGDVEDGSTPVNLPSADILFVTITEDGDNVNVSMTLVGAYDPTGMYYIYVTVDGEDSWSFSRMNMVGFMVTDSDFGMVSVDGYYSADGKVLSWVVAKTDIPATTNLEVEMAMTSVGSASDYAGLGGGGMGGGSPDSVEWMFHFPSLNKMEMKVTMTFSGDDAADTRTMMDADEDGTVTQAEVDAFVAEYFEDDEPQNASESNVTLDGKDPTDIDSDYSIQGAAGSADSTSPMSMIIKMTLTFPKLDDKDSHEVKFDEPLGDDIIDMGDMSGDTDVVFKFQAPDGWVFKSGSVPSKMKDYMNDDGDEITMKNADIEKDWNNTFADLQSFTIEKADSPGFGLAFVVVAATVAALAVRRRQ